MSDHFIPPIINGLELKPIHHSRENGVHTNLQGPGVDVHIPYVGQTTLQTFGFNEGKGLANDRALANLGGTLVPPPWIPSR